MARRSRHGLHAVRDGDGSPAVQRTPSAPDARARLFLRLDQRSVVLAIAGRLNADTAGRLRMHLTMFTGWGGPRELVLDLSGVLAVDEDGMAPIFEADEAMRSRSGSVRLTSVPAAVAHFLDDVLCDRTLTIDQPPEPDGGPAAGSLDENGPTRGPELP